MKVQIPFFFSTLAKSSLCSSEQGIIFLCFSRNIFATNQMNAEKDVQGKIFIKTVRVYLAVLSKVAFPLWFGHRF